MTTPQLPRFWMSQRRGKQPRVLHAAGRCEYRRRTFTPVSGFMAMSMVDTGSVRPCGRCLRPGWKEAAGKLIHLAGLCDAGDCRHEEPPLTVSCAPDRRDKLVAAWNDPRLRLDALRWIVAGLLVLLVGLAFAVADAPWLSLACALTMVAVAWRSLQWPS